MHIRTRGALLALALCLAACRASDAERPAAASRATGDDPRAARALPIPRPTEHWLDERAEGEASAQRKQWKERIHQTAPGVDWREIERANGLREMERRNRLATEQQTALVQNRWTEVGSKNLAGRMHCAALGPGGAGVAKLYAGSAHGGLWHGNADGTDWQPLGDNLFGGAHEIVVLPAENAGEPDFLAVASDGGLFHVSRDGGATWETPAGLPTLTAVRGLAKLEDAARTIVLLANYNAGGSKPALFTSHDYGRTFVQRWIGNQSFQGSMWVPRVGPGAANMVYVLQKGRLFVSTNGGTTLTQVLTIDATATAGVLAGSEAGAPTLYAALRVDGVWKLFRSDDGGGSFAFVHTISDFFETLCASTLNPHIVMYGGVEVWRSFNGGASFTKFNGWGEYYSNPAHKLHADSFGIHVTPDLEDPLGYERWWISTDGGLYLSPDIGLTVDNLSQNGLAVSQYYSTLTSRTTPNLILAGAQDQGYQRGTWQPSSGSGPSTAFTQLISGDYGHLTSSDGSHALVYSVYPGFVLVQQGETNPQLLSPFVDFPAGSSHAWLPPIVADPLDPTAFFFCGEKLYRYKRVSGPTWNHVVHSTHDFLVGQAAYLSAIAFAPSDPQRMYAANDRGRLFSSSDHGVTWTNASTTGAPGPHYFYGNALAVHPSDSTEAAVGGSGYSTTGVWRTTNGGTTWAALASGLPQTLVYDLAYAEDGSGDLYAATEAGAWRWVRASAQWENVMQHDTPLTTYWSVESVDQGATMRFGTYGRGIWDYAIPGSLLASWHAYGSSLAGANVATLSSRTPPVIGALTILDVTHPAVGEKTGWVFWSTEPGSTPMQGGTFLLGATVSLARVGLDAGGTGSIRFPIANEPSLVGESLYFQALLVDSAQAQGIALSNGLQATFGP